MKTKETHDEHKFTKQLYAIMPKRVRDNCNPAGVAALAASILRGKEGK